MAVYALSSTAHGDAITLQFPVLEQSYDVTEGWIYSDWEQSIHGNVNHVAVDIEAEYGSPIIAAHDGYAVASYEMHWQKNSSDELDCNFRLWTNPETQETAEVGFGVGYFVQIYEPTTERYTQYAHLARLSDKIERGSYNSPDEQDSGCWENFADGHKVWKPLIPFFATWVERGEVIGYMGNSGLCFGRHRYQGPGDVCDAAGSWDETHLHFAVYDRANYGTGSPTDRKDPYDLHQQQEPYPDEYSPAPLTGANVLWELDGRGMPKLWIRAPENVELQEQVDGVHLSWTGPDNADTWWILRTQDPNGLREWRTVHTLLDNDVVQLVGWVSETEFLDIKDLEASRNYYYAVAGVMGSGEHYTIGPVSGVRPITTTWSHQSGLGSLLENEIPASDAVVARNQAFLKTWTLKNVGTDPWTSGTAFTYLSGDRLQGSERIPITSDIPPGASTSLSTTLIARLSQ